MYQKALRRVSPGIQPASLREGEKAGFFVLYMRWHWQLSHISSRPGRLKKIRRLVGLAMFSRISGCHLRDLDKRQGQLWCMVRHCICTTPSMSPPPVTQREEVQYHPGIFGSRNVSPAAKGKLRGEGGYVPLLKERVRRRCTK